MNLLDFRESYMYSSKQVTSGKTYDFITKYYCLKTVANLTFFFVWDNLALFIKYFYPHWAIAGF